MSAAFDHRIPEELTEFQKVVRRFAVEEIAPVIGDYYERGAFPYDLIAKMGAMGLFGLPFPEEYGGMGADPLAMPIVLEELARVDSSVAITLEAAISLGATLIFRFGTEQQRQRYLPALAAGRELAAFALTEPGGGSDTAAVRTTARREGSRYVINGTKAFITNSGTDITSLFIVAAVTGVQAGGRSEISSFIVPAATPGITVGKKYSKVGWLASDTHEVAFSDCAVPAENLLGAEGRGYAQFLEVLDEGRIGVATIAVGLAQGCVDESVRYSSEREAFGHRIGEYQAVRFKIADMEARAHTARLAYLYAASRHALGEPFKKEAAIAKLVASDAAVLNAREATQIFGGYGFVNDTPVARFWRDAKILEIGEGTSEVLRILIARELGIADHGPGEMNQVLWQPSEERRQSSVLARYMAFLREEGVGSFESYDELWRWSVTDLAGFWASIWRFYDVGPAFSGAVLSEKKMPGCRWFDGATLNYAEQALGRRIPVGDGTAGNLPAVFSVSQTRGLVVLSRDGLAEAVSARAGLIGLGVRRGNRVVGYLPNIAETIVAFLATAGIGAVWSSCPPEFGRRSVMERFSQLEPKVLLAVDGYRYGEKVIDRREDVATIRRALSSLEATVSLGYLGPDKMPGSLSWESLLSSGSAPEIEPVPFEHPLYVLFSSGTTRKPKAIVHGHGGIVLEHLKAIGLHCDLTAGDRFFWYSTTGWMMWNFLVSGLLVGATVVCFDGDPGHPDLRCLWSMAEELAVSYFGASAPYYMACKRQEVHPGAEFDLSSIRTVGSTGAPLPAQGYEWVYEQVGRDLQLASVSGGTDLCTPFVGESPYHPVRAGRMSCRYLAAAVEAYAPDAKPLIGEVGELVITTPMPSMPLGFWDDPDARSYEAAYFSVFPGVWHHADWITIFEDGSCEITGRSDATLNRGGVRIGTGELYAVVEGIEGVEDSLVLHLEDPEGGPGRILLFVVVGAGNQLDDVLCSKIRRELSVQLSPRHVPDLIQEVPRIPRTLSGKKLEVPVKRILLGADAEKVASADSLLDPESLSPFLAMARSGIRDDETARREGS